MSSCLLRTQHWHRFWIQLLAFSSSLAHQYSSPSVGTSLLVVVGVVVAAGLVLVARLLGLQSDTAVGV